MPENPISTAETKKRYREYYVILAMLPVIGVLIYVESHISIISGDVPVATNVLILGLININILFLIILVFLILRNAAKLFYENKIKLLGSKLRTKLVASFVMLTVIPAFLLFIIVIGFVNKSIDAWFDIKVEESLKESLELARNYHKDTANRALSGAWRIASQLSGGASGGSIDAVTAKTVADIRLRDSDFSVVEVFSASGKKIVNSISSATSPGMIPETHEDAVNRVLKNGAESFVDSLSAGDVVRAIVPVSAGKDGKAIVGVVVVSYYIPSNITAKMEEISASFEGYKQLKILRNPVKASYFTILLAIMLLITFSSIWIGQSLAKNITEPIFELAEGTNAVAGGNLDYRIEVKSRDEIGQLVKSFNRMTEDLKAGKEGLEQANLNLRSTNTELDRRRRYIEIVLGNIPAGVISIDSNGTITSINKVALEMLSLEEDKSVGMKYVETLRSSEEALFTEMITAMNESRVESIERQITVNVKGKGAITLFVMLNALRDEGGRYLGTVAVLDDLTHLLKTQRMLAWKEVAQRIAHEIKNPLTPIQLSAERLRKKYLDKFSGDGAAFDECTQIIIKQVDELKTLVNEFSSFARMPAANPTPNDLNKIVAETVSLYRNAHRNVVFSVNADESVPVMDLDRDQIKRALINLIDNAVDSLNGEGRIAVDTHYDRDLKLVRMDVSDNGSGISNEDKARLFEPYFSTKKSGTGLGLAIVSNIVSDHNGYVRVKDNVPKGTRFVIELPVKARMV